MGASSKIALGVAGGYFLGRTKKLKLALALGGMLAGKRLAGGQDGLLSHGSDLVEKNPELAKLQHDSGNLLGAAKAAALTTATQRLHSLSSTIRGHAQDGEEPEAEPEEQPGDQDDQSGQDSTKSQAQKTAQKSGSQKSDSRSSTRKSAPTAAKKTTKQATKKAAKKSAKKSSGANRSSSGR